MDQIPGLPGIDGINLVYGSWHLLNEALTCYLNKVYFACLICLSTSVELWLKRELKSDDSLENLLKKAKSLKLIDDVEFESLNRLRNDRNSYVHFNIDKLPKSKHDKTTSTRIERYRTAEGIYKERELYKIEVDVYATPAHRDMFPLAVLAVLSYFHLNSVTKFFQKRYPCDDSLRHYYYNFTLLKIDGLDENEVVFQIAQTERAKKTKKHRSNFGERIRKFIGI